MQAYSDPQRADDPHALPDVQVFYLHDLPNADHSPGWYWWSCFPGCLPDSDPVGPFPSEAEALADAQLVMTQVEALISPEPNMDKLEISEELRDELVAFLNNLSDYDGDIENPYRPNRAMRLRDRLMTEAS